jgi:protein SCO1/2
MRHLALVLGLVAAVAAVGCSTSTLTSASFLGTELKPKLSAEDFTLQNQLGHSVSLSDRRGDVVVLTFLYSTCPDVCPVTASQLRDVLEGLDGDAGAVSLMAVSVDPEGDSAASAKEFTDRWELTDSLDFLLGDRGELVAVWDAYYLDPSVTERSAGHTEGEAAGAEAVRGSVDALRQESARYLVVHSAPIYVIDREGFARSVFTLPFATEDLVHDVRLLLE